MIILVWDRCLVFKGKIDILSDYIKISQATLNSSYKGAYFYAEKYNEVDNVLFSIFSIAYAYTSEWIL